MSICDNDGTALVQRADDTEEAFHQAHEDYRGADRARRSPITATPAVSDEVDGDQTRRSVAAAIDSALQALRASCASH